MKNYYLQPYSNGISFAFIRSMCKLTGDDEMTNPVLPNGEQMSAHSDLLRRKLKELSLKYSVKINWFTNSSFPNEINQLANELIAKGVIDEHSFLFETESFLQTHPDYLLLPPPFAKMRKPLV